MIKNEKGFTLLELTIILIVIGLIATPFIKEYRTYALSNALSSTNNSFFTIESAIQDYYELHGYLPCPAESYEDKVFDAGMGVFVYSPATTTMDIHDDVFGVQDCAAFAPELNNPARTVLIGSVPTKTLGLDADFAIDGWNNKIAYVVSKYMLNIPAYDAEQTPVTNLNDTLDIGIEFFSRDTSGIPTCNTRPVGGFQEKYIIRDRAFLEGDAPSANTLRPSALITSIDEDEDVAIINHDPVAMANALCRDTNSDGVFDQMPNGANLDMDSANHVLLVSYGPTANGAFNAYGAPVAACDSTTHDGINCFRGSGPENNIFYTNGEDFDAGGTGPDFYDDITYAIRADTFKMFTVSRPDTTPASNDSYSPYQIIGIGTDDPMGGAIPMETSGGQKLPGIDVGGDIMVEPGGTGDGRAMAASVCDEAGTLPDHSGNCFTPSIVSGSGVTCAFTNTAVSGLSRNNADCFLYTPFVSTNCGANELMVGINPDGTIICEIPPFP